MSQLATSAADSGRWPADPPDELTSAPPIERARRLAAEFAGTAAYYDRTGRFPAQNFARLREAGLLALTVARSHGGLGGGLADAAAVVGAIAAGEPSTALVLVMQYAQHALIARGRWPKPVAERVIRDAVADGALINGLRVEPELGTPMRGGLPATTARRTVGGWSISGRKIYSTGCSGLTWAAVWARTDEERPRVGSFLVPMKSPGVSIVETWDQLGMRATASHDVVLENVRVPEDHAVDVRFPEEWARADLQSAWVGVLTGALYDGVARAARDWLIGFLRDRKPSNMGAPLATLPRVQEAVGHIAELLAVNARLIRSAAVDTDEGRPPTAGEAGLLKLAITENAIAVVEKALRLTGNHGVSRTNPLERHFRDVQCARIHSPQEDSARLAAGRAALVL